MKRYLAIIMSLCLALQLAVQASGRVGLIAENPTIILQTAENESESDNTIGTASVSHTDSEFDSEKYLEYANLEYEQRIALLKERFAEIRKKEALKLSEAALAESTFSALNAAVEVYTIDEFQAALDDEYVTEIVLMNDIDLDGYVLTYHSDKNMGNRNLLVKSGGQEQIEIIQSAPDVRHMFISGTGTRALYLVFENVIFDGNGVGGGLEQDCDYRVEIRNPVIKNCYSSVDGGGISFLTNEGGVDIYGGRLEGNRATRGGGVYAPRGNSIYFWNTEIIDNFADYGGGIYSESYDLYMRNGSIAGNGALFDGGGAHIRNLNMFNEVEIHNNTAGLDGGGIYSEYGAGSMDSHITNNTAGRNGGGIYGQMDMFETKLSGNKAELSGGGIYSEGDSSMQYGSEISNNQAVSGAGGGIYSEGQFHLFDSPLILNNSAKTYGGGVYLRTYGHFEGASIKGNYASSGGGIYTAQLDFIYIDSTKFDENTADTSWTWTATTEPYDSLSGISRQLQSNIWSSRFSNPLNNYDIAYAESPWYPYLNIRQTVSFDSEDMPVEVVYGGQYPSLPESKTGTWYTSAKTEVTEGSKVETLGDHTLYSTIAEEYSLTTECIDEENNVIYSKSVMAREGDRITVTAPEVEYYSLNDADTKTIIIEPKDNKVVFQYTRDTATLVIEGHNQDGEVIYKEERTEKAGNTVIVCAPEAEGYILADDEEKELFINYEDNKIIFKYIEKLEGQGNADSPYLIYLPRELAAVPAIGLDGHYQLMADITLADIWLPIGTLEAPFTGVFDGNGHSISGLETDSTKDYQGLFGVVQNAKIINLQVRNSKIAGNAYVGLIGYDIESEISECSIEGDISGDIYVGGIVGYKEGGVIRASYTQGHVAGSGNIGGIVGQASGAAIHTSANLAEVTAQGSAGGIAGTLKDNTVLANCVNYGAVSGFMASGIAGVNNSSVISSMNVGVITGKSSAGGIAGSVFDAKVEFCVNAAEEMMGSEGVFLGRIAGTNSFLGTGNAARASMKLYSGEKLITISKEEDILTSKHGKGLTSTELFGLTYYEEQLGWDFADIWEMTEEYPLPVLQVIPTEALPPISGGSEESSELVLDVVKGEHYLITITGTDITTFEGKVFVLAYDADALALADAAAQVQQTVLSEGIVLGTDIEIVSMNDGELEFKVNREIPAGKRLNGALHMVKLRGKADGETTISIRTK